MRKKDLLFYTNNNINNGGGFSPPLKRSKLKYATFRITPTYAKPIKNISDSDGLKIAYSRPNGIYNYGNTLYIAGTKSLNDS